MLAIVFIEIFLIPLFLKGRIRYNQYVRNEQS